jgi:hypothetical protein
VHADLPDLVTFMLGTGVRIGEALAILWNQVDLEAGTVEITRTIARPPGEGLIRKTTKSRTGERTSASPAGLPPCSVVATPLAPDLTTPSSPTGPADAATPPTHAAPCAPHSPPSAAAHAAN